MAKTRKRSSKSFLSSKSGSPRRSILIWGSALVAVVLLIVLVLAGTLTEPEAGIPEGTREISAGESLHVEGEIYGEHEVPVGGEHSSIWANCGFYTEPISAENAVHSLEHGAVWITYQPSISEDELDVLRPLGSPTEKVLVSPIEAQEVPILATAWGFQLELDNADDPRLDQFIAEFAGSLSAPEPGGSCRGGVGNPE